MSLDWCRGRSRSAARRINPRNQTTRLSVVCLYFTRLQRFYFVATYDLSLSQNPKIFLPMVSLATRLEAFSSPRLY